MFTEKQITKLTAPGLMADHVFIWARHHILEVEYEQLSEQQIDTLMQLSVMNTQQHKKYVIIDDRLVEVRTNVKYYSNLTGEWVVREQVRYNKKQPIR